MLHACINPVNSKTMLCNAPHLLKAKSLKFSMSRKMRFAMVQAYNRNVQV